MDRSSADADSGLREIIWRIILEMAPAPSPTLSEHTRLVDDLGYHSLALLELAFALEEEFGLPAMDAGQAQSIITMLDVEKYVLAQSKPGSRG